MSAVKTPLHDLSSRARHLQISVDAGVSYDLLLVLWAALGGDDKAAEHALGATWFDDFRSALSEQTKALADRVSPHGVLWAVMLGVIEAAPVSHDLDHVIPWLEAQDPKEMRTRLMTAQFSDFDPDLVAAAAEGDASAVDELLSQPQMAHKEPSHKEALRSAFLLPSDEVMTGIVEVMKRARREAFQPHEADWTAALARDAIEKRVAVANAANPRELIETVSNGISYDVPPGVRRVVIIPSVALRPWTLITDSGDGLLVCCPVSEDSLIADPDAPPAWLVATYRALGDEKRLRLLRRLAERPATLAELTEFMGMAKSTVFHHMGVLRAAGLVRVTLSSQDRDKENTTYSLRFDSIPDRAALIDLYLNPTAKEIKP